MGERICGNGKMQDREIKQSLKQVRCPHCGYRMPVWYAEWANCIGVFVTCKNKNCKKQFEIKVK